MNGYTVAKPAVPLKQKQSGLVGRHLMKIMKRGELSTHMSHDVHKNSVVLISEKEKHGTFWKKAADKVRFEKVN